MSLKDSRRAVFITAMRFVKRHQFLLAFLAVLVFSSVMVVRQVFLNQWAHADLREDFILLHDQGRTKEMEHLYQMLIQTLPRLPDRALVEDDQRLAFALAQKSATQDDLVWKYHVNVRNELQRRTEARVARALKRAQSE